MGHANDVDAGCGFLLMIGIENDDIFISAEVIEISIPMDIVSAILLATNANIFCWKCICRSWFMADHIDLVCIKCDEI